MSEAMAHLSAGTPISAWLMNTCSKDFVWNASAATAVEAVWISRLRRGPWQGGR